MLPVAILAGGLGTRLHPLTADQPKSLLLIAGRPFLAHQLELLRDQGVERVVLCVGHLGEQIRAFIGDGHEFGLTVDYSFDGPQPLGTGGALRQALPQLGARFFVLYGDAYLPCSFAQVQRAFERCGRAALMTVLRNDNRWDRSNVAFREGGRIDYDKSARGTGMTHIDFGLSVLASTVFAPYVDHRAIDLADIHRELSRQGALAAFEVAQRFYEIGSPRGLRDTESFLSQRRIAP
jgi:MurNAc alpha-1-phosphate uridylyltransferase